MDRDHAANICGAGAAGCLAAVCFNIDALHNIKAEVVVLLVVILTYILLDKNKKPSTTAKETKQTLSTPPTSHKADVLYPSPEQLLRVIKKRRSIFPKDYNGKGRKPTDSDIELMLEAANWAPTHKRTEPWRFVVLRGPARNKVWDITFKVVFYP